MDSAEATGRGSGEWVCVVEDARELGVGQILEWEYGEQDLVIWRSESGQVCAMEARCPHQWSHLGSEGMVVREQIVCCTHFWCFDLDGTGWKENEHGRRDKKADIATFPCREQDGKIFVQI